MFNNGDSAPSTGIIFAIYTVGQMVGSLWADKVTDRYGRRAGMFVGCCVIVLGTIVISTATGQGQFIGGKSVFNSVRFFY
jgi:MFS family permease